MLLPIVYITGAERSMKRWATLTYGVVPSVSIHRLTTEERSPEDKPSEEIDLLTYRLGVFGKWSVPGNVVDTLTVRGFATYVSDTGMETGIPVAQFEIEPQIFVNDKLGIGYRMNLIPKHVPLIPGKTDYDDNSWLGYQLRLRLHAEYGRVVDAGRTGLETESFFRMGPITELKIAPLIWKNLSVTLAYSYLPAVIGPDDHNTLFTADAQWILIDDKDKNGTLSLKANYTKGGIDVTEQKVDTFQVGLGATF